MPSFALACERHEGVCNHVCAPAALVGQHAACYVSCIGASIIPSFLQLFARSTCHGDAKTSACTFMLSCKCFHLDDFLSLLLF